jgi:hypothetical protein
MGSKAMAVRVIAQRSTSSGLALAFIIVGIGLPQGQYLGDRRPAIPDAYRQAPRWRLHDLLYGHQLGAAIGTILVGYLGQT